MALHDSSGHIVLHQDTDVLLDSYGVIKADEKQYRNLDPAALLRVRRESYGYCCLTGDRQFYLENYPGLVVERGTRDEDDRSDDSGEKL